MDALRFIHAFAPIISKAAMQTYYSALPLMPLASLLSKKYSAMSRPSLKLSESSHSQIITHPQVILPLYDDIASSDNLIALSHQGEITFFDTRTGNEIGSGIPAPYGCYPIALSPDGKCIAIQGDNKRDLEIWDVKNCICVKTIRIKSEYASQWQQITYSADGEKVMVIITIPTYFSSLRQLVFVLDVKTDEPLKQLEVNANHVAISPDGSQIAIIVSDIDKLSVRIINVSTGRISRQTQIKLYNDNLWTASSRIVWSPNGQFLASVSKKEYTETEICLLPLTRGSAQVPSLILPESSTGKHIVDLVCSPDSSKIVAGLWDYEVQRMTLYICCTRLLAGTLIGTTSVKLDKGNWKLEAALSFATNGQDILICQSAYNSESLTPQNSILHHFSVVPTHLETYMNHPPKFHPSQTPHTIQYSHHISGAIGDYASHVDSDGWIVNMKGGREIWTPWANYELLCSCKPPSEGQTQYRTLEVRDPETKTIVLIYVIAFEQKDVNNGI